MRFQQCMKGLFANRSFFKSLNNSAMYIVANLFICMISSRGGGGGGGGELNYEILGDEVDYNN